jgi:hypothetical protein
MQKKQGKLGHGSKLVETSAADKKKDKAGKVKEGSAKDKAMDAKIGKFLMNKKKGK